MDLPSFAAEAKQEGAVLLNCVQSELGDNGYLQSYLQQKEVQVLHTGSDVHATALCHDKVGITKPAPLMQSPAHIPVVSVKAGTTCVALMSTHVSQHVVLQCVTTGAHVLCHMCPASVLLGVTAGLQEPCRAGRQQEG